MTRPTDHRALDLSKLNTDVAFRRAGGMIIWQPRIQCWFTDKEFAGIPLPEPYEGLSRPEVYRSLGCSNRIYQYNDCFVRVESEKVVRREEPLAEGRTRKKIETAVGSIESVSRKTPNSPLEIREKFWVETPGDLKVATHVLDETSWRWDQEVFDSVQAEWGDLGAPTMYMPRINVQDLYINTMGVENAVYALLEWGSVVEDYFRALHECHLRMIEVIDPSPIQLVCFGDNLHCSTLSPKFFERYVEPAYHERCDRLHRAGKFVFSHWDGDTKALLPYAKTCGLDGIEAITPLPQGDVTLQEMKEALGEEVLLLDGVPAILFDTLYPEEELIAFTERVIDLFAPNLILGISDEMSSTGDLERVRTVGRIVDDYNAAVSEGRSHERTLGSAAV